jgi:hypothetical protein
MIAWGMRFDIVTRASPEQVRRALTSRGPTWALARESTPGSPFWVVARYDWSDPDEVRWSIVESSYGDARRQKVMLLMLMRLPVNRVIARMWTSALDRHAQRHDT